MRSHLKVVLAGALGAAVLGSVGGVAQSAPPEGQAARQSYIVRLEPGTDARGLARALSVSPRYVYSEVFDGFAADLTAGQLSALRRNGSVAGVELDRTATAVPMGKPSRPTELAPAPAPTPDPVDGVQELPADGTLWGLDRIDPAGLDDLYGYPGTGAGVTAYVVDSGIATAHPDFGGRARAVFDNAAGKPARDGDCNGHGTHVAGTIGGTTHGVAKRVQLRSVRVLDCNGNGPYSGVIAGLDHIAKNHSGPSVANLSLGGPRSDALNAAVTALVDSGVFVAVSAGNESVDACGSSPASAPEAVTVAASDAADRLASFSNHGSCVDVVAPGVDITSTWLGGRVNRISGTSMASPHVAGAAAVHLGAHPGADPGSVAAWIAGQAVGGVVSGEPAGTPDLLLNVGGPIPG